MTGIALVIWGYTVNAANNAKEKEIEKTDSENDKQVSSVFGSIELNNSIDSTQVKAPNNKTIIESDKQVEESSGTE